MAETKKAFHEQVAEQLIEQLKQGTAPWQRPWHPGEPGSFIPLNPTTGKRYRGINAIQLLGQGRTDQRFSRIFLHRYWLPSDHRLIDGAGTIRHHAVHGHLFTRANPQDVSGHDPIHRDILFSAICAQDTRRFRCQAQQQLDRRIGAAAGTQFQYLTQQHQRRDHRCRLEVDRNRPAFTQHVGRKDSREQ